MYHIDFYIRVKRRERGREEKSNIYVREIHQLVAFHTSSNGGWGGEEGPNQNPSICPLTTGNWTHDP